MIVDKVSFPFVRRAFFFSREVDRICNGGHPAECQFDSVDVPDVWSRVLPLADVALERLHIASDTDFFTFAVGEMTARELIRRRQGDLDEAERLLVAFNDGWPAEGRPAALASA